jgi:hypothetical protein
MGILISCKIIDQTLVIIDLTGVLNTHTHTHTYIYIYIYIYISMKSAS